MIHATGRVILEDHEAMLDFRTADLDPPDANFQLGIADPLTASRFLQSGIAIVEDGVAILQALRIACTRASAPCNAPGPPCTPRAPRCHRDRARSVGRMIPIAPAAARTTPPRIASAGDVMAKLGDDVAFTSGAATFTSGAVVSNPGASTCIGTEIAFVPDGGPFTRGDIARIRNVYAE